MTMRSTLALCAALAGAASSAAAIDEVPGSLDQLKELRLFKQLPKVESLHAGALKGRDQYRQLVTPENYQKLGLPGADDAVNAQLGTPVRDYLVRLDRLSRYKSGDDVEALLTDTQIVQYPLVVGNDARAMVSMSLAKGDWQLISVGESQRTARLFREVRKAAKGVPRAEGDQFSVRIPALLLEFAGSRDAQNGLLLTPLQDDDHWGLKAGVAEPAGKVFARLAPSARTHDGLPR
jgi:hypothetical protein